MPNSIPNWCFSGSYMINSPWSETLSLFTDDTVAITTAEAKELLITLMKGNDNRLHSFRGKQA